ncbi:MAG: hypothetical protein FWG40_12055 [Peptococcaceae bacterium]|nr:hypothetical protein [Peptococcaceae bacterium]
MNDAAQISHDLIILAQKMDRIADALQFSFRGINSKKLALKIEDAGDSCRRTARLLNPDAMLIRGKGDSGSPRTTATSMHVDFYKLKGGVYKIQRALGQQKLSKDYMNAYVAEMSADWEGKDYIAFVAQWTRMSEKGSYCMDIIQGLEAYLETLEFAVRKYTEAQYLAADQAIAQASYGSGRTKSAAPSHLENEINIDPMKLREISQQIGHLVNEINSIIDAAKRAKNETSDPFGHNPVIRMQSPSILGSIEMRLQDPLAALRGVQKKCVAVADAFEEADRQIAAKAEAFMGHSHKYSRISNYDTIRGDIDELLEAVGPANLLLYERYKYYSSNRKWKELLIDSDGNPKNAKSISDFDYQLLALVYRYAPVEEMNELVQLLFVEKKRGIWQGIPEQFRGAMYIEWELDQEKYSKILVSLEIQLASLEIAYDAVKKINPADIIVEFPKLFDSTSIEKVEIACDAYKQQVLDEKLSLKQKHALLIGINHLDRYADEPANIAEKWFNNLVSKIYGNQEKPELIEFVFTDEPPIKITMREEKNYFVSYSDLLFDAGHVGLDKTLYVPTTDVMATKPTNQITSAYINDGGYYPMDEIGPTVDKYAMKKMRSNAVKNISTMIYGESSKLAGAKAVPYFGDIIFTTYDIVETDYQHHVKEIEINKIEKLLDQSEICENFSLESNVIEAKNISKSQIIISTGSNTPLQIYNYNTWVEWKLAQTDLSPAERMQISSLGTNGKLNLDDIINSSSEIAKIWNNGPMGSSEIDKVFKSNVPLKIVTDETGKSYLLRQL